MIDLEIRVLGPVELWLDFRQVSLGTPKQQCLVAALALHPGRPVTVDALVERLWGDETPGDVRNSLYTYVARLRRTLWRESAGAVSVTRNTTSYSLRIDPQCVDIYHARELVQEASVAVGAGRDDAAARLHSRALGLWRGEPLCGLRGDWAERTRAGLRQEMLTVLTARFAAELRLGRHASVVGELSSAVSEHPLDEALASQLMLCLYRSHRHADAIAVYHRIKASLAERLGLDPGPCLRQLYSEFLRNDSSLDLDAGLIL